MKKQIKVEQEEVRVKIDFPMVWAFMWRFYLIVLGLVLGSTIAYALLVSIIFTI